MTTFTTGFSDDYLTEWLRLARLADDLRAVGDGHGDPGHDVDALLAFEEDAGTLVAERLVDARLVGSLAAKAHRYGVGLTTVAEVLVRLGAVDVVRDVLTAGVPLPLPASWLVELAADRSVDVDAVPQPRAGDDPDAWVAWQVARASRGWSCFLESAVALEARDVRLDEWDAPRYPVRPPGC